MLIPSQYLFVQAFVATVTSIDDCDVVHRQGRESPENQHPNWGDNEVFQKQYRQRPYRESQGMKSYTPRAFLARNENHREAYEEQINPETVHESCEVYNNGSAEQADHGEAETNEISFQYGHFKTLCG